MEKSDYQVLIDSIREELVIPGQTGERLSQLRQELMFAMFNLQDSGQVPIITEEMKARLKERVEKENEKKRLELEEKSDG